MGYFPFKLSVQKIRIHFNNYNHTYSMDAFLLFRMLSMLLFAILVKLLRVIVSHPTDWDHIVFYTQQVWKLLVFMKTKWVYLADAILFSSTLLS